MNDTIFTTYVMYYSLFQKRIFENKSMILDYLPQKAFGVFTTIRRHTKVKQWPFDIHGCIGYWNHSLQCMTKEDLHEHLLHLFSFKTPILLGKK
jgi:hypothetical protein